MNKQDYLRSVSVLSDPVLYFEYDKAQIATMARDAAKYKFTKCAQGFAILATICTMFLIGSTWVVQQNTLEAGLEVFIVSSVALVSACVMIQPVSDLFHRSQVWDQMENELNQVLWETRPNAKYEK